MQQETMVVNIRFQPYDVYIGRAGHGFDGYFGNPYVLKPGMDRGSTLFDYRKYFESKIASDPVFKERVIALKGKRLGCFCKPHACHGDIIKEWLDKNA